MITTPGNHHLSIMVLFAITLHLGWAGVLYFDDVAATDSIGIASLYRYIRPTWFLITVIVAASLCATIGLWARTQLTALLLLPQQVLLMMSAAGAFEAIWLGQVASGALRPRAFIAAGVLYSIVAAIWHTVAIIAHVQRIAR